MFTVSLTKFDDVRDSCGFLFRKGIVEDLVHSKYVELTPLATDFVETYSVRLRHIPFAVVLVAVTISSIGFSIAFCSSQCM